jgi:N-acetylated-alpha-linked acidic dipeptidase
MMGFTAASTRTQRSVEAKFKDLISAQRAREFHRRLTLQPHPAGTPQNKEIAEYIAKTWREQGIEDVVIRQYDVLSSLPKEISLELVSPVKYKAGLREDSYSADPDTSNPIVRSAWTSMSASGEITAPVVYANSGNPADYDVLKKAGIDVRGKIVLVRYSNPYSYRGFKALTAEQNGAAAILIYSDPAEDGYKRGKVFPDGPWGPESHIQRGAITYDFIVPGDPLTPGWASVPGAKRIPAKDARSLPQIMALALSWRDAKPLLKNMGGVKAPGKWQGGLPITYRLGGAGQVHLKIEMDTRVMPYYNVEARIRGGRQPEQWVVLGNHHDAWEFGGVDPSSGTASMLELTGAFGNLLRQGIRPARTLVFCSWDGEEVGLTGSTEWGEQFEEELRKNTVAYLNVDSSTSGPDFHGSAVASLAPMLLETTRSVSDPKTGKSLYDAWQLSEKKKRSEQKDKVPVDDETLVDVRIGSGSDHTVFLNHDGVPVIGLEFDGSYGVYHSMYDNFYWMNQFGDPGYRYHALMSQLWGAVAMRLANADILPFDYAMQARKLRAFTNEVAEKSGARKNLDLRRLLSRIDELESAGKALNLATEAALSRDSDFQTAQLNRDLIATERNWLTEEGIPGRDWFKHTLYAARYTYAHLELPGLTEAVEKEDWRLANEQAQVLERATKVNTELLRQAAARLMAGDASKEHSTTSPLRDSDQRQRH